jgi:hypothetical protein
MSAETDLYSALTADSGVAALVSTRIYPNRVPLATTYPAIGYSMISSGLIASELCQESRIQIDMFDSTYSGCKAVRDAVLSVVNGRSDWGYVQGADIYEDDTKIHHQSIDVIITH